MYVRLTNIQVQRYSNIGPYCYRMQIESAIFYAFVHLRSYRVQREVCPAAPDKSRTGVIELPVGGNRELTVKASDELLYAGSD